METFNDRRTNASVAAVALYRNLESMETTVMPA